MSDYISIRRKLHRHLESQRADIVARIKKLLPAFERKQGGYYSQTVKLIGQISEMRFVFENDGATIHVSPQYKTTKVVPPTHGVYGGLCGNILPDTGWEGITDSDARTYARTVEVVACSLFSNGEGWEFAYNRADRFLADIDR